MEQLRLDLFPKPPRDHVSEWRKWLQEPFNDVNDEGLEVFERLKNMQNLEALERLEAKRLDYRLVEIPEGATVYADPPYRGTNCDAYCDFDFDAFDAWLGGVDFPVYVSEYTAPMGCVEVASIERTSSMPAHNNQTVTERIFVQERYAHLYQPSQTALSI